MQAAIGPCQALLLLVTMMQQTRVLCMLALTALSSAAVIGIDFGGEYIKAALVKPRVPLDIVVNPEGRRRTEAVVGFVDGEQFFGKMALGQQTRRPANFVAYLKMLLGKGPETVNIQWLNDTHYPQEFTGVDGAGTLKVKLGTTGLGDDMNEYTVAEMVAMILTRTREDAEAMAEEPIKDVVITVPPFWAQDERQALLDAAELAGMNVLGLMNENSAVAMKYAIDKKYDATKEHNVVFYDMGSTSVKTSLVSFYTEMDKKKERDAFKVKAVAWDEGCGGHVIDARLATKFAKEFDEKNGGESILDSPRAMARLRMSSKKTKETLTANKETPVNVEALANDIDFRSHITRNDFNEMNVDLWDRAIRPVQQLLADSGMTKEDVHACVIVGGSSLIPIVQEQLISTLGLKELTRNLDVYEAAALGAGFYAAGLSPSFRVREVGVTDLYPFGIAATVGKSGEIGELSVDGKSLGQTQMVFEPKETVPNKKFLVFTRSGNFSVDLKYSNPAVLPADTDVKIGTYNLTKVVEKTEKFNTTEKPTVTLELEIDRNGMATLSSATAGVTEWSTKAVKIPRKKVNRTEAGDTKKKSTDASDDKKEDAADNATKAEEKDSTEGDKAGEAEKPTGNTADDAENTKEDADSEKDAKTDEAPPPVDTGSCGWNVSVNVTLGEGENATEKPVQSYLDMHDAETKPMVGECGRVNTEFEGDIVLTCKAGELSADASDCTKIEYELKPEKARRSVDLVKKYKEHGIRKLSHTRKESANGKLKKIQHIMDDIRRLAQSKNDVEAHIFETRDLLEYNEEIKAVLTEEQTDKIRAALSEAEEWLWEDHEYGEYVEKVYALRDDLKPALTRKSEAATRPVAISRAQELLTATQDKLSNETFMENMPANETEKMIKGSSEFKSYLDGLIAEQAEKEPTEEPAFMTSQLTVKTDQYEKAMQAAMAKKPKAQKKKPTADEGTSEWDPDSGVPKKTSTEEKPLRPVTTDDHLAILTLFYNTATPEEPKTEEEVKAIMDKRKDEGADALTKEQFETLCAKLHKRYDIEPVKLWQDANPLLQPAEEEREETSKGDVGTASDEAKEKDKKDSGDDEEEGGGGWFGSWGGKKEKKAPGDDDADKEL